MTNGQAFEQIQKEANRYNVLNAAIKYEIAKYEDAITGIDADLENASENISALLIGRKYAYIEFVEKMKGWCNQ